MHMMGIDYEFIRSRMEDRLRRAERARRSEEGWRARRGKELADSRERDCKAS
ncbi:MAG: hypothetical protein ACRDGU_02570 [Actinomycetota bacterium]